MYVALVVWFNLYTLVFWQSGRQIQEDTVGLVICDGDQNQQLFKGFLLSLVCVFEVKLSSSEDTLRHFVVNFSLYTSEVSQVLSSARLQWETNYCQTTPMQKRNPRLKLSLRLLRFCSWQLLLYIDGWWCVFIPCVILSTVVQDSTHLCPFFTAFWNVL